MRSLLLTDDVKMTLAVEKSFLEARNLRTFVARSAGDVLDLADILQPDLIVMDYEMPGMRGDAVCRRLREKPNTRQIPIMILSSHEDEQTICSCIEAGADEFVQKAEGREALLDRVAAVLGKRQRRHVRVACNLAADVESEGERLRGLIHDLSVGGLYLTLGQAIEKGKALQINFTLPDAGVEISALGEVVRTEALGGSLHGHGVQLLQADDSAIEQLGAFVERTL